jgi:hypothetical protein
MGNSFPTSSSESIQLKFQRLPVGDDSEPLLFLVVDWLESGSLVRLSQVPPLLPLADLRVMEKLCNGRESSTSGH